MPVPLSSSTDVGAAVTVAIGFAEPAAMVILANGTIDKS